MLKVQNLQVSIEGNVLIKNLSFELTEPTFLAIIGHNGSGKTSLLHSITNLLPYKGEIFLSSKPALLSQKNNLNFDITAKELAVMGIFGQKKFLENYTKEDYDKVSAIFTELNIVHLLEVPVLRLSGGEQQLVWMAQLFLQNKEILIFDEPTQYLDIKNKKRFFTLANKLIIEQHKLIICVTHDILNLYAMSGYILNLSKEIPTLEPITKENLDKHLTFLEK